MTATLPRIHPLEAAREIAAAVLRSHAADVDARGRFPAESVEALRQAGLLGFFVPERFGGTPGGFAALGSVAASLGEECLSTALIWAMHCQHVAVLARHAADAHGGVLEAIAERGLLVASVTTETGKGGDLLTAEAPLAAVPGGVRVRREAPVVSYGAEAAFFLITMRAAADRPPNDVRLVLAARRDGEVAVTGDWNAMGMRGTRSVPMTFDVTVAPDRVLAAPFAEIALQTLIPAGHVGWSAAWLGAARGAFTRFVRQMRREGTRGRRRLDSDLLHCRLAELRLRLDLVDAMLERVSARLDSWTRDGVPAGPYGDIRHTLELNNLKVAAAREAFSVVDGLVELAGLAQGYLKEKPEGLERVFRDLRSATLMFHNDRLLKANGKLLLVEGSPMAEIWSPAGLSRRESGGELP
jgi:acyl-CoA dehydrogenase